MRTLPFAFFAVASLAIAPTSRADDAVVLRTLTGDVPANVRAVRTDSQFGNVTVTAVEQGFGWDWTLRSTGSSAARVEAYAQACRLEAREDDGVLTLKVIRPEPDRAGPGGSSRWVRKLMAGVTLGIVSSQEPTVRSDLTLRVPAASLVDVKNRFGIVQVAGTRGAVGVDCRHGRVELSDIDAAVTARTTFASLRVRKIGSAQLTNQNGSIDVEDVGGELRAATSFARLKARDVKGGAVLKNQNGAIEAARIRGDVDAATSFGDLRIEEVGGKADLRGQNSRVEVRGVTGALTARNSFGALHVHGVGAGAVLKNQNGLVEAKGVTGDLVAETSFGGLRIEEIGGNAALTCRNGAIDVVRVTGDVRATNAFGPIRVREVSGGAELEGQNSEIAATGVTGDIRAQTSFARLRLEGNGRRFAARNQNGTVEIVARSPEVQHIEASATFAPIELRLPGEVKPLIRAATSFGKVRSEYPVLQADTMPEERFAADATPLKVSLEGQNGDIRIERIAAR